MNDNQMTASGQPRVSLDAIKNAKTVECTCGGIVFKEKLVFKKLSAIMSPSGKEELVPMPIVVCESCGKVPAEFDSNNLLPSELRADTQEK